MYYDPETGRFISPDNISFVTSSDMTGLNLFAYCGKQKENTNIRIQPAVTGSLLLRARAYIERYRYNSSLVGVANGKLIVENV